MKPLKVCMVTCYKHTNYVRIKTLEAALQASSHELIIVRNSYKNLFRYIEVVAKLIKTRFIHNPDVYLVTFRGYEILPAVLLVAFGKKVIFDEFINPIEWVVYEHKKIKAGSVMARVANSLYRFFLKKTTLILADTDSHAQYSSTLSMVPLSRYWVTPVGVDEKVFTSVIKKVPSRYKDFTVLYYGSMLPLHGVQYVIGAAIKLKDEMSITFLLVGGDSSVKQQVDSAVGQGAHIIYKSWIPYEELPTIIQGSDLCLGGPFGGTVQAQHVITGKTLQFIKLARPTLIGHNNESSVFEDKENILITKQKSAASLADTILWAYRHPSELNHIGKNGARVYEHHFSAARITANVQKMLDSI